MYLSQNFNITDCLGLQNIITNNSTVNYFLNNDIDCNSTNFVVNGNSSSPFKGTFFIFTSKLNYK